ncbi:MAG: fluoroacetyl-CoA thioesterase [Micromonosporaceae bacterium]|nr:fluoroacetyl-CoA thioesterase [Micromonosporaceae bacterium]
MQPRDAAPDSPSPDGGPPAPAVGRAHVRGGPGGLDATAGWVGAVTRVQLTVTDSDTAQAVGSGDVPVLGTPRVLALVEAASVGATASRLPPGATTVGIRVELDHRVATPVGRTVVAEARLAKADGRRLTFEVSVRDGDMVVAEGRVERIVVDRQTFIRRAFGQP